MVGVGTPGREVTIRLHNDVIRGYSFQVEISRNASSPRMKKSALSGSSLRKWRIVSIEYDGPGRSNSTADGKKNGLLVTARSTILRRCVALARSFVFLCGGCA